MEGFIVSPTPLNDLHLHICPSFIDPPHLPESIEILTPRFDIPDTSCSHANVVLFGNR